MIPVLMPIKVIFNKNHGSTECIIVESYPSSDICLRITLYLTPVWTPKDQRLESESIPESELNAIAIWYRKSVAWKVINEFWVKIIAVGLDQNCGS